MIGAIFEVILKVLVGELAKEALKTRTIHTRLVRSAFLKSELLYEVRFKNGSQTKSHMLLFLSRGASSNVKGNY